MWLFCFWYFYLLFQKHSTESSFFRLTYFYFPFVTFLKSEFTTRLVQEICVASGPMLCGLSLLFLADFSSIILQNLKIKSRMAPCTNDSLLLKTQNALLHLHAQCVCVADVGQTREKLVHVVGVSSQCSLQWLKKNEVEHKLQAV